MLNCINIQGRLVRDPSLKQTTNGTAVLSFPIACDYYANGNKTTDFFDCVAWKTNATFISNHFKKGDTIILTGRLSTREYQTQQGDKRKVVEIIVSNVEFAGGAKKDDNAPTESAAETPTESTGELPFEV